MGSPQITENPTIAEIKELHGWKESWRTSFLYEFQGFWCQPKEIDAILSFQKHYLARDSDVILATIPKSGTTWIKSLTFAIMNRNNVPYLSLNTSFMPTTKTPTSPFFPSLEFSPLIFRSVRCRNRLRVLIVGSYTYAETLWTRSSLHAIHQPTEEESRPPIPLEEAFDMYCKGVIGYGPFWEHMLGYWKESQERPSKVLFMTYEDMKEDAMSQVKMLANFLGLPFSVEEEKQGLIEEIVKLCSFKN
ncbi:hypothetical protein CXB51_004125 [Gossypium anomalum]|uniref:Sulfotransferase n=1 Tax=Gossypium anomalum TaxID=47600 RepID=A0A8J6D7Z2_9ROSI|nr:hypothetical protein CXB51_004125 [Gossypium anomalum]